MKRYIRSNISNYRGYDIEIEKSGDQRYYFVDDYRKIHYADLEDELKSKIDEFIEKKNVVESSSGWYVGDPDPSGRMEGRLRYLNKFHSWNDVYKEFAKIADKYFPDDEKIEVEIEKFYRPYAGEKYFDEAYRRWKESAIDEEYEEIESSVDTSDLQKGDVIVVKTSDSELRPVVFEKYKENSTFLGWEWREHMRRYFLADIIYHASDFQDAVNYINHHESDVTAAVKTKVKPFVVTYMYDDGDAESGPHAYGGEDLVYAEDEDEACRNWEEYCDTDAIDNYCGCNACPATPEDVDRLEQEKKDYGIMNPDDISASEDFDDDDYNLLDELTLFLEDCAQETGAYDYTDIVKTNFTPEVQKKIARFMNRYMAAADDGDEARCNRIGKEVADYLKSINASCDVTASYLPDTLMMFLQDVAQETGAFTYTDIPREVDTEAKKKLNNFKRRYWRAAEDQDEKKLDDIGEEIAEYLKSIK